MQLNNDFIEELIDRAVAISDQSFAKKDQRTINKLQAMIEVVNFGSDNWRALIEWDSTHHVLSARDIEFINLAIGIDSGKTPSEKQALIIIDILEKSRIESFPL